jgi:23S rRNA pseudouridine2605 synthase
MSEIMRLNKYIAHSGVCSRRKAADLVKGGKIKVNNKIEKNPAYEVQPKDLIEHNGKILRSQSKMIYVLMNKPKNVLTTTSDEKDILKNKIPERIYPVGRLDRNTTGLLLLTNDGQLAKKLSHPSHNFKKRYHVILNKPVSEKHIEAIRKGLTLEDGFVPVDDIDWIIGSDQSEVGIEIHIGRNRIVRRIFESLGYVVEKLDRVYYAGLTKKDLPRGWFRQLLPKEVIMLKHFTEGPKGNSPEGKKGK